MLSFTRCLLGLPGLDPRPGPSALARAGPADALSALSSPVSAPDGGQIPVSARGMSNPCTAKPCVVLWNPGGKTLRENPSIVNEILQYTISMKLRNDAALSKDHWTRVATSEGRKLCYLVPQSGDDAKMIAQRFMRTTEARVSLLLRTMSTRLGLCYRLSWAV